MRSVTKTGNESAMIHYRNLILPFLYLLCIKKGSASQRSLFHLIFYLPAITSTSHSTPLGRSFTATQDLAGASSLK